MLAVICLVAAAQTGTQVPTAGILSDVATWAFLGEPDRRVLAQARQALKEKKWQDALEFNESLLASAPSDIFLNPPRLPTIDIRPAGSPRPTREAVVVDGHRWRLEAAWLAAYSRDFDGAARRFDQVRITSVTYSGAAAEGMAFARMRQGRWREARVILSSSGSLSRDMERLLNRVQGGQEADWRTIHDMALGSEKSQPTSVATPTLRGEIGQARNAQVLPPAGAGRASSGSFSAKKVQQSASVEAALILAEAWSKRGPGEPLTDRNPEPWATADRIRQSSATYYINVVLRNGGAFPHHQQIARDLARTLGRVKGS